MFSCLKEPSALSKMEGKEREGKRKPAIDWFDPWSEADFGHHGQNPSTMHFVLEMKVPAPKPGVFILGTRAAPLRAQELSYVCL